jgi:hypothetical protein
MQTKPSNIKAYTAPFVLLFALIAHAEGVVHETKTTGAWLPKQLIKLGTTSETQTIEGMRKRFTLYTQMYHIKKRYPSMKGPYSMFPLSLGTPGSKPERLWIKAIYSEVVDQDGHKTVPQQLMCHVNVEYNLAENHTPEQQNSRLVTLSQGQYSMSLPEGFGIPILSNQHVKIDTMVLNHKNKDKTYHVRHKIIIDYIREKDLKHPLKPLFQTTAFSVVEMKGDQSYLTKIKYKGTNHHPTLLTQAVDLVRDQWGRLFPGHWAVKPGKQVNETLVTRQMHLPFDTTIHHIDVHLHPFAESLELKDLTTNTSLFKSHATQTKGQVGLEKVESFSSRKGIPVYQKHEYALISTYNNNSQHNADAMGAMYIHLYNKHMPK